MCRFPYIAVQLRADMDEGHDPREPVARLAALRGLRLRAVDSGRELGTFAAGGRLVATFDVNHCACDWKKPEHEALAALARDLLAATDVRRVRVGLWSADVPVVAAGTAGGVPLREIDTDALAEIDWSRDVALEVRRAPHPPFPKRPLRKLG